MIIGLASSMSKVYQIITERIISLLEKGTVPWHKPWKGSENSPRNLVSSKPYRGVNVFVLQSAGYDAPYWLTFKQAKDRGGAVKKGQHGSPVVYWKWLEASKGNQDGEAHDDEEAQHSQSRGARRKQQRGYPLYYTVFNVEQTEGVLYPKIETSTSNPFTPVELCERVVEGYHSPPTIEKTHPRAFYRPPADLVGMPKPEGFDRAEDFYSTLFHELTHSTGHASRLGRPGIMERTVFGDSDYSKEELIAEMGAAFLSGHCGIEQKLLENSAAYIDSWLSNLREDSRLVVHAAAQGQKAADYILDVNYDNSCELKL